MGSVVVARGLSSCGLRASLLRGMWDLPRPALKPMSPALAGRFLTTAPQGKSPDQVLNLGSVSWAFSISDAIVGLRFSFEQSFSLSVFVISGRMSFLKSSYRWGFVLFRDK